MPCIQGYRTVPWRIVPLYRVEIGGWKSTIGRRRSLPSTSDPKNAHRSPHRRFQAIVGEKEAQQRSTAALNVSHSQ